MRPSFEAKSSRFPYIARYVRPSLIMSQTEAIAKRAKLAFESSQLLDSSERIHALGFIKEALLACKDDIVEANKADLQVHI